VGGEAPSGTLFRTRSCIQSRAQAMFSPATRQDSAGAPASCRPTHDPRQRHPRPRGRGCDRRRAPRRVRRRPAHPPPRRDARGVPGVRRDPGGDLGRRVPRARADRDPHGRPEARRRLRRRLRAGRAHPRLRLRDDRRARRGARPLVRPPRRPPRGARRPARRAAQAPPAGARPLGRREDDVLDVRPARGPQRAPQPRAARRPRGGVRAQHVRRQHRQPAPRRARHRPLRRRVGPHARPPPRQRRRPPRARPPRAPRRAPREPAAPRRDPRAHGGRAPRRPRRADRRAARPRGAAAGAPRALRAVTREAFLHYMGRGYEIVDFQRAVGSEPPFYELARHP
jgi:hypothetical protein